MKNITFLTIFAFLFSLMLAGTALAEGKAKTGTMGKSANRSMSTLTADELKDMDVQNRQGKDIGEVSEVKLDQSGNIQFLVISSGGVLGMGSEKRHVPFSAFRVSPDNEALILNVDESLLTSAPKKTQGTSDDAYNRQLYEHFGQAPYWGQDSGTTPGRGIDQDRNLDRNLQSPQQDRNIQDPNVRPQNQYDQQPQTK